MRLNGKISALLSGAWKTVVSISNYSVDPPRAHLKYYALLVVAVSIGGCMFWAPVANRVHQVFNPPHIAENRPFGLISPREVIASVPPPAPVAEVKPAPVKVVEVPAKKKVVKRKPKKQACNTVFC